jgi:thiamine-phosphate pyrophosphorylase
VDAGVAQRAGWAPTDLARAYLDGGARLVQLRATGVEGVVLLGWCREIVRLAAAVGAHVILNDRSDLALMACATGVHLGQQDFPIVEARRMLGSQAIIGLSTHDDRQVAAAVRQPVSYLAVGPVFETRTKDTGYGALGLAIVRRTVRAVGEYPVVAIGGITLATAPDVIAAGAASVAVISDLLIDRDPARRVNEYVATLGAP